MSNAPSARASPDAPELDAPRRGDSTASVASGGVRADTFDTAEDLVQLHHHLRAQLRETKLESAADTPALRTLLRMISAHYEAVDEERRGIVQSMRLMADEARTMAREAREQSSEHLQVILDHIKDVVLTVDEDGTIRTFNPTGERVFGFSKAEVLGRRIDRLLPLIAEREEQSFLDFALQNVGDVRIAAALCFEITETAAVTDLTDAIHFMRALQARGCRFALDDFGSGISSFLYLKTLPVDFLKIDGQFIRHVADDPVDRSMVEAICKVGKALGIATVAESVETAAVLGELERLGVDFRQGYYLARPRPLAELNS